jgi:hypothetical protein
LRCFSGDYPMQPIQLGAMVLRDSRQEESGEREQNQHRRNAFGQRHPNRP